MRPIWKASGAPPTAATSTAEPGKTADACQQAPALGGRRLFDVRMTGTAATAPRPPTSACAVRRCSRGTARAPLRLGVRRGNGQRIRHRIRHRIRRWNGNQKGTPRGVQARCGPHVGVHQASIDVALGLHHNGVGFTGHLVHGLIAFVGQGSVGAVRWCAQAGVRGRPAGVQGAAGFEASSSRGGSGHGLQAK